MRRLATLLLLGALAGCVTERTYSPIDAGSAQGWRTVPETAWCVRGADGALAGYLVQFGAAGGSAPCYFSVRNALHQELGTLDSSGRAWRFAPHAREAQFLGSGDARSGAARILGSSGPVELVPASLDEIQAGADAGPAVSR